MANATLCPPPFLPLSEFASSTGGYSRGRFCGPVTPTITCCLPCPLQQWVSSNDFERKAKVAYWSNVPALICQVFLLLTFAVLPKERSGRHYMSIGLCLALILLELSFIIPLGTKPDQCYDKITPKDMYNSESCAWSGALLEVGSMAAVVWILLRSLWTHLRVCWDVKETPVYVWVAHALGWGLPALFLAISLSVTGVSYRIGPTCIPNPHGAFVTWFGWLIAFAVLGFLIQFSTTGFCLAVYVRSFFHHDSASQINTTGTSSTSPDRNAVSGGDKTPQRALARRLAWRRVHKVLTLQWRSIVLSLFVIVETIYFGTVYAAQVQSSKEDAKPEHSEEIYKWTVCLITTGGDKEKCLALSKGLSLPESTAVASFFMVSLIGLFTFGLMIRWQMLLGWWELIPDPRRRRQSSAADEWVSLKPKHKSFKMVLGSNKKLQTAGGENAVQHTGILPSPKKDRHLSVPQAGDVAKRHQTTTLFQDADELYEEEQRRKMGGNFV